MLEVWYHSADVKQAATVVLQLYGVDEYWGIKARIIPLFRQKHGMPRSTVCHKADVAISDATSGMVEILPKTTKSASKHNKRGTVWRGGKTPVEVGHMKHNKQQHCWSNGFFFHLTSNPRVTV